MSRFSVRLRLLGGAVVLVLLLWRFGTGPFADAWRLTTWPAVLGALAITAVATVANAWRWRVVAAALGAPLGVGESMTAYYRSQFLNATLPGGVLGDAHRGVRHGRAAGDVTVGLRATVWDRVCGQAVQLALLVLALVVLPTPLRQWVPLAVAGVVSVVLVAGLVVVVARRLVVTSARRRGLDRLDRRWVAGDVSALLRPAVAGRVAAASAVSATSHVAVFGIALAVVGVGASPADLIVVALAVLAGCAVPLSLAGWGPREGVAAGLFGLAGLGSATGLTVSVVFGVLAAVATLPGAVVLLADAVVRRRATIEEPARLLVEAHRG